MKQTHRDHTLHSHEHTQIHNGLEGLHTSCIYSLMLLDGNLRQYKRKVQTKLFTPPHTPF